MTYIESPLRRGGLVSFVYAVIIQSSIQDTYVDRNKAIKTLLASKADISHRLDHYVAFVARMCTILHQLGVEDSRINSRKAFNGRSRPGGVERETY